MREVGRTLNISESTVRYIMKCFDDRGNSNPRKRGGNGPKKLTQEIQERIENMISDNNLYTLAAIAGN